MPDKIDYDALIKNDNVRQMLDIIKQSEGTSGKGNDGYNVAFGGHLFDSYDDHPRTSASFKWTNNKTGRTSAAGAYQFLASTWDDVAGKLGLTDFSPDNQDKAAVELIRRGGALNDVTNGDYLSAIKKLGTTWASLPSSPYAQPKKSMQDLIAGIPVLRNGQSVMAVPETMTEHQAMTRFALNNHPVETQAQLAQVMARITDAQNQLMAPADKLNHWPDDLDDELMQLIRMA